MSCQRCHRGRIKPRFGEQEKKKTRLCSMAGRLVRVFCSRLRENSRAQAHSRSSISKVDRIIIVSAFDLTSVFPR